ncbi:hypothetical protein VQ02_10245 [Methylobacterium variabile]|uniref:Uncharacterized protein n=1 Tax=Methylobacterium variabile TaxID=298794 RepID=A0A0J6T0B5_9HYPH|nr:hypothetical protein [Methylobacterium variabile]KMO39312.1 hypothetical protein VQ02_10245 [Methylobacterium variabile]
MSAGLSSLSDADLMRMLGAARGEAKRNASSVTVPSPFSEEPAEPEGLSIRVQPNNSAAPAPVSTDTAPAAVDLSGLSNGELMRQLMGARAAAAKAPDPASFGDRFGAGPTARQGAAPRALGDSYGGPSIGNDQAAADALYGGLQRQADERLIGPSSAGNAVAAGVREFGNSVALNAPRNIAAAIASAPEWLGGNGASFDSNYHLARDQEAALARQNPKSALAGTIGGIGAGAVVLPAWGGASSLGGRALQAGITGTGYGAAGEFLDSKDLERAGYAGAAGFALGGAGSVVLEKAAPVVLTLAQRGIQVFRPAAPGAPPTLTAEAAAALREVGVDPASLPADAQAQLAQAFQVKGVSPAVAREAIAAEQGITLSRGQATQDPQAAALEAGALAGSRGARAQGIATEFDQQQAAQIAAARDRLQGGAARGVERIDNPQTAFEAVADRARLAGDETAQRIAAARQAEQEALQAVSGPAGTDALSGAQSAVAGVREAAEQARGRYRAAYGDVAAIPGTFAPGALSDVGTAVRRSLGPEVPIDPVLTPAAARAVQDLDNLPAVLGLGPDQGPDLRQVEQVRKRLVSYYGGTAQNPTDRRAMGAVMNAFDQRIEDLMAVGRFGQQPPPVRSFKDVPASLPAPRSGTFHEAVAAQQSGGAPETLTRYLARTGGIALDDEARAADLNRHYVPGYGTLARRTGRSVDDLRVALQEEGFFPPDALGGISARDVQDRIIEAIQREQRGQPLYRAQDEAAAAARNAARGSDEAADYAARLDRETRRTAIALEAEGLSARDLDPATLRDAAEMVLRREVDDAGTAYERAARERAGLAGDGAPRGDVIPDAPFPGLGEAVGPAASDALPIGDTAPAEAMRKARGLFRDYKEAFSPRGPGDVAGQRLRQIVERDASPSDMVTALFGTTTGKVSAGQMQTLARVRGAVGADSETWRTVQQALIARYLGGESQGLAGRLDYLLRGEGRALAAGFLSEEQRAGLGRLRSAINQTERAQAEAPAWVSNLERSGFDPNAIAASLFGSGVPGSRVGAAAEAKAAKAFLGEGSQEWAMLRQAAVQRVVDTSAPAAKLVERLRAFTEGPGSGLARELFGAEELSHFRRLEAALRATIRPDGAMRPGSDRAAAAVMKAVDLIAGAVAFKIGGPGAGLAAYGAKLGQRALVGGVGASKARASFESGAPRVPQPAPVLDLRQIGPGSGLTAEYGLAD